MIIIIDTREQLPFTFERFPDVAVESGALSTGDYSLAGFESVIACERKELNDLIACLQNGNRERFEKELARGAALHRFCVLVEASLEDISRHRYKSQMEPKAALQSIFAFQIRYGTTLSCFVATGPGLSMPVIRCWVSTCTRCRRDSTRLSGRGMN